MTLNDVDALQVCAWLLKPTEEQVVQQITTGIMKGVSAPPQSVAKSQAKASTKKGKKEVAKVEQKRSSVSSYFT